jgi:protein gp37
MSDGTTIEWTEATWNPITGCSVTSPGCTNCYAMKLAGTRLRNHESRAGLTVESKAGPVWTGEVRLNEQWLDQPLRWKRPRMIFVCAHGDLFHESVPDEWIDKVFAVMALAPQHTFQVLPNRSKRMRDFFAESTGWRARIAGLLNEMKPSPLWNGNVHQGWQNLHGRADGLPNVWLGV